MLDSSSTVQMDADDAEHRLLHVSPGVYQVLWAAACIAMPALGVLMWFVLRGVSMRRGGIITAMALFACAAIAAPMRRPDLGFSLGSAICGALTLFACRLDGEWRATAPQGHFTLVPVKCVKWLSVCVTVLVAIAFSASAHRGDSGCSLKGCSLLPVR